jgi:broad specificity phosphatase PhoE
MKTLEIRRHSMRKGGGGSQLSQDGVDLARRLGSSLGPFAVVATSVVPRARETAVAMGFAVDHELVTMSNDPAVYAEAGQHPWWLAEQPFKTLTEMVNGGGAYGRYAHALAAVWRDMMTSLPDGNAALVIGHSGELESGLAACLPSLDWGGRKSGFGPCEGARLVFGGEPERFTGAAFLSAG